MKYLCAGVLAVTLIAPGLAGELPEIEYPFENVGLGGGGGMYTPAVSPHDPRLMFMTCDMSGVYRSADGGVSWKILPFRQIKSARSMKITFDPNNPAVMYTYGGPEYAQTLQVSRDYGLTWKTLADRSRLPSEAILAMEIDRTDSAFLIVGDSKAAWISRDGGKSWLPCKGIGGRFVGFYVIPGGKADARTVFAASEAGLWRSDDSGATWVSKTAGITGERLTGFCGGTDAETGETVLFCTIESQAEGGKFAAGGVFRSADLGESWQSLMTPESGLNVRFGKVDVYGDGEIAQYYGCDMASNRTDTVYVAARGTGYWPPRHNTVYKSTDSGKTWEFCFSSDARFEEKNVEIGWLKYDLSWGNDSATMIDVCDTNPDVVLRVENGATHLTTDGGKSWRAVYTSLAPDQKTRGKKHRWVSTGMEVTTTWHYFWDPLKPSRQFICYTDIGFGRSDDDGKSWVHSPNGSPWRNTFYDMAFDPDRPGVIYAACSNVHDIPHASHTDARSSR
ncbi:MAG: WD40/YVTN/BNR-like repeat-containing protein, partial [Planctomycetota bacterium]